MCNSTVYKQHGCLVSCTDVPDKSLTPFLWLGVNWQRYCEIEAKEGLENLDKDCCRKTEIVLFHTPILFNFVCLALLNPVYLLKKCYIFETLIGGLKVDWQGDSEER